MYPPYSGMGGMPFQQQQAPGGVAPPIPGAATVPTGYPGYGPGGFAPPRPPQQQKMPVAGPPPNCPYPQWPAGPPGYNPYGWSPSAMPGPYATPMPFQTAPGYSGQVPPGGYMAPPTPMLQDNQGFPVPSPMSAQYGNGELRAWPSSTSNKDRKEEAKRQYDLGLQKGQQTKTASGPAKSMSGKNGPLSSLSGLPSLPSLSGHAFSNLSTFSKGDQDITSGKPATSKPAWTPSKAATPPSSQPSRPTDEYLLKLLKGPPPKTGGASGSASQKWRMPPRPIASLHNNSIHSTSLASNHSSKATEEHFTAIPADLQRQRSDQHKLGHNSAAGVKTLSQQNLPVEDSTSNPSGESETAMPASCQHRIYSPEDTKAFMGEQDFHNVRSLILKQQEQLLHQVWELHRVHQLQRHKTLMSRHTKNLERQTKFLSKKGASAAPASTSSPDNDKQGSGDKEKQGSNDKQGSNGKQGSNDKQGSDDKSTDPQPASHPTATAPAVAPSIHLNRSPSPRPMMWPNQPVSVYGQSPYYPGGYTQAGMGAWSAPPNQQQYMQMMSQYYANSAMPHPYAGYSPQSMRPDQMQPAGGKGQMTGPSSYPQPPPMAQYAGASYDAYMNWYNTYNAGVRLPNPPSTGNKRQEGKGGAAKDRHHRKEASCPNSEPSKPADVQWWKDPREVFGSPVTGPASTGGKGNCSNQSDDADLQRGPAKLAMKRQRYVENTAEHGGKKRETKPEGNKSTCSGGSASAPCE